MMRVFYQILLTGLFMQTLLFNSLALSLRNKRNENEVEYPELWSSFFEGDIILLGQPDATANDMKNAVSLENYKWPDGIIPYVFASNYTASEMEMVRKNMDAIESSTCVKFVTHENARDGELDDEESIIFINKIQGRGCYAAAGYRSDVQLIPVNFMAPECFRRDGTLQHELLHVLGLLHEQSRPDRDEYVTVEWNNIDKKHYMDFGKAPRSMVTTFGIPYDFDSVMHYPNNAFSKNGKPTLVAKKNSKMNFGQRNAATESDLEKVRKMYGCKK